MPRLREVKGLSYQCLSDFSLHCAKCIYWNIKGENEIQFFRSIFKNYPKIILEALLQAILNISVTTLDCFEYLSGDDDAIMIKKYSQYVQNIYSVMIHPQIQTINHQVILDLRKLSNFMNETMRSDFANVEENTLIFSQDQLVSENKDLNKISETLSQILNDVDCDLIDMSPTLLIIGREGSSDDEKVSIVWNHQLLICLSRMSNLVRLNLEGYHDLSDLALEYMCGLVSESKPGKPLMPKLQEIILPEICYVSYLGVKALLQNLPELIRIKNAGCYGKIFDKDVEIIDDNEIFGIEEFDQSLSLRNRCINNEEDEEDDESGDESEILTWVPTPETLERIRKKCPFLNKLSLLIKDEDLKLLWEQQKLIQNIELINFHICKSLNNPVIRNLSVLADYGLLKEVSLTLLDGFSWQGIHELAVSALNLHKFHLELWSVEFEDLDALVPPKDYRKYFPSLRDLRLKTDIVTDEDNMDFIEIPLSYLLYCDGPLNVIHVMANLSFLNDDKMSDIICELPRSVEMMMFTNCDSKPMNLSLTSVHNMINRCPNLCVLGNLRSWTGIDYFNCNSEYFFKSESEFIRLKQKVAINNWDLDLDMDDVTFTEVINKLEYLLN